jgi:hypothetical protein
MINSQRVKCTLLKKKKINLYMRFFWATSESVYGVRSKKKKSLQNDKFTETVKCTLVLLSE